MGGLEAMSCCVKSGPNVKASACGVCCLCYVLVSMKDVGVVANPLLPNVFCKQCCKVC